MMQLQQQITQLKEQFIQQLSDITSQEQLEQIRVDYLGRSGHITGLMKQLAALSVEEKKLVGPLLNELKRYAEESYTLKSNDLIAQKSAEQTLQAASFDVTAYTQLPPHGGLHVYTQFIEQIENIVTTMGYEIVDGPELETDYYNFSALNIPENHPARDMHDTFWISSDKLLRTQTSNAQIHAMEKRELPISVASIGRVYRNEATDASHEFMFMQLEMLYVAKDVSISNLLATIRIFLQQLFGKKDLAIRVRPGYFPFVEPGIEVDASCPFCTHGCSTCKYTRWIELLGCGLVHPNVLRCSGIDPTTHSGFAFGMGLERVAMIKYGINDIRLFHSYKYQFLKQF